MKSVLLKLIHIARIGKGYIIAAQGLVKMAVKRFTQHRRPTAVILSVGGANSSGGPLARVLENKGFRVTAIAPAFPTREAPFLYGWKRLDPVNDIDRVVAFAKDLNPAVACSDHRNFLLPCKTRILDALGLESLGDKGPETSNDKIAFRRALDAGGAPGLDWQPVTDVDPDAIDYPTVFKPALGTGSRGVMKIANAAEARTAKADLIARGDADRYLREAFIQGRQFDVEGICRRGEYHVLAIIEEHYIEADGKFPSGWYVFWPPLSDEMYAEIRATAEATLRACGVQAGAFHVEMRMDAAGKCFAIDYSNRFGYPHLVSEASGVSFIGKYVETLLPDTQLPGGWQDPEIRRKTVYQRYLPTAAERTKYRRLITENPGLVIGKSLFETTVGETLMYGNVCLKLDSFADLVALLRRYDVVPESMGDYYDLEAA